jgi:hypothetical protein
MDNNYLIIIKVKLRHSIECLDRSNRKMPTFSTIIPMLKSLIMGSFLMTYATATLNFSKLNLRREEVIILFDLLIFYLIFCYKLPISFNLLLLKYAKLLIFSI